MATGTTTGALYEVAGRIRALRGEAGYSVPRMAELTGLDEETYRLYEAGETDLPFTFIHKCAQVFRVEIVELMEGSSARLSRYAVTRRGKFSCRHKHKYTRILLLRKLKCIEYRQKICKRLSRTSLRHTNHIGAR